jgi:hypothetical protein
MVNASTQMTIRGYSMTSVCSLTSDSPDRNYSVLNQASNEICHQFLNAPAAMAHAGRA